jgi:hypothetical protein
MKNFLKILLFISTTFALGQEIKEYYPAEIRVIQTDFSDDFVKKYNSPESLKRCVEIWDMMSQKNIDFTKLSPAETESLTYCDEFEGNPWSIKSGGCSWYCGGMIDTIYSSSSKEVTALIHDNNYGNAWQSVKSQKLKDIYIIYAFNSKSAKVSDIVFVNGNVKSNSLRQESSRVKKIKMYVKDKVFAVLNLQDIKNEQIFRFKPFGKSLNKSKQWFIKFEIIETYPGKNETVSIAEIYFDGDGGH